MNKSTIHPSLKPITIPWGKRKVILTESYTYKCPKTGVRVYIESGFEFDGASIPRILWSTTGSPFMPQYIGPGLVHDYLYRYARDRGGVRVSRKLADKVFKYALELNKVSGYQKNKIYQGVNWFGFKSWNKHRKVNP